MKIRHTNLITYKNYNNFKGFKPHKKDNKLTDEFIQENLFFVNMETYGKNKKWAKEMYELYENITELIVSDSPFNNIISKIEDRVGEMNIAGYTAKKGRTLEHSSLAHLVIAELNIKINTTSC